MKPPLFLDEDINPALSRLLAAFDIDALSVRDADRLGMADPEQFEYAKSHGRVFVTFNYHDFEVIARREAEAGRDHAGIIVSYHQFSDDELDGLARAIDALLAERTAEDMRNMYLVLPKPI